MFACLEYSHLDKCVAIIGANLLSSVQAGPLWTLILFILFTATINLIDYEIKPNDLITLYRVPLSSSANARKKYVYALRDSHRNA